MAGAAPQIGLAKSPTLKVAIITASWHQEICDALVSGAQRACSEAEVKKVEVFYVPGSFELPLAAQYALEEGFDVAIVVGLVLRGETPHFDYVCQGVTQGVMDVQLKYGKPIGFGVLMCDSLEQAQARSGLPGSKEDKGYDAAVAAISMVTLRKI